MSGICVKNLTVGMVETNCCLVYNEETKQAVIVDPGDAADVIREECRKLELSPELILLTHGHFDHIMAAEELRKEWGIKICACEKELEVLRDSKKNLMMDYYRKDYTLEPDLTVCDGETFEAAGVTWKVIETPGHTIGSSTISSLRIFCLRATPCSAPPTAGWIFPPEMPCPCWLR